MIRTSLSGDPAPAKLKYVDDPHAVMTCLKEHLGKTVDVLYFEHHKCRTERSELKELVNFQGVGLENCWIPFVGYPVGITMICCGPSIIYFNPHIWFDTDFTTRSALLRASFGRQIASRLESERAYEERRWQSRMERLDNEAKLESPRLIAEGLSYVKPAMADGWSEFARVNTQDGYSCAVVRASIAGLRVLSEGAALDDVKRAALAAEPGLSGYQMGAVAHNIASFAARGEEWRLHWNAQYLSGKELAASKGTVNPAVMTLHFKEQSDGKTN